MAVSGCALLDTGGWSAAGLNAVAERRTLKPLAESVPDGLQLEYVLVERPVGDPLLGGLLWDGLDQIGAMKPVARRTLADQGLRIGVASSSPPEALQKLLGERKEIADGNASEDARRLRGQRLTLRSGGESEVQTSDIVNDLTVAVAGTPRTFQQARGIVRVIARAKQDGWATLEFLPEIHHGVPALRPAAGENGWTMRTGQEIQKFYDLRFELTLNEGESAVISSSDQSGSGDRVGDRFFTTNSAGVPVRRLLIVRVVRAAGS